MSGLDRLLRDIGPERPQFLPEFKIREFAAHAGLSVSAAFQALLSENIWPERFRRNQGALSARQQSALLSLRVFIAGCGGLGGEVASLLARLGVGGFRLCDPDIFEESNLNRQRFCTEKSVGKPKALIVQAGLMDIASWLDVEALTCAATSENLPELFAGMDVIIDCLDSVARKKMLEQASAAASLPYLHGSVLDQDGFVYLDIPGQSRLAALYPDIPAAEKSQGPTPVLAPTVTGTATIMVALLLNCMLFAGSHASPLLHLDFSVPELETFSI